MLEFLLLTLLLSTLGLYGREYWYCSSTVEDTNKTGMRRPRLLGTPCKVQYVLVRVPGTGYVPALPTLRTNRLVVVLFVDDACVVVVVVPQDSDYAVCRLHCICTVPVPTSTGVYLVVRSIE